MVLASVLVMSNLAAKTTKYKQLLMVVLPVNLAKNSKLSPGIHLVKEIARVMVEVEEDVAVTGVAVLNNMVLLSPLPVLSTTWIIISCSEIHDSGTYLA